MNADLNEIKALLEKLEYQCEIVPPSESIPYNQLAIALEPDELDRGRFLIIRSLPQDLSAMDEILGISSAKREYREMHFIVTLPFYVKEEKINETARCILFLNKGLALKGFELSEADRLIFFHHACVNPEADFDERILLSLIGMIELFLETLSQTLESIATGRISFAEVLQTTAEMIKKP